MFPERVPSSINRISIVVRSSSYLKMIWVAARRVVAFMPDAKPIWNISAIGKLPRNDMSICQSFASSPAPYLPVPSPCVAKALPLPAIIIASLNHFCPKSIIDILHGYAPLIVSSVAVSYRGKNDNR